ncbi:MAG: hypothetical protein RBS39_13765 [Phycisphaerales bacterium]|jgi:hypothetical protein|nr:hypothetical protein [Phycisphaerales bacterium]
MNKRPNRLAHRAALALIAGSASVGLAQNGTIYYMDGFTQLGTDSFSATSLFVPVSTKRVVIVPDSGNDIPQLTFQGSVDLEGPVSFILGTSDAAVFVNTDISPTLVGGDCAGIDALGVPVTTRFYGGIAGDLTGELQFDQMSRFDVGGEIQDDIEITAPSNATMGIIVEAGAITSTGSVRLTNGRIGRVKTFTAGGNTGDMAGRIIASGSDSISGLTRIGRIEIAGDVTDCIEAPNGDIDTIVVDGDLGDATTIGAILVDAATGVRSIAAASISGKIMTADLPLFTTAGYLQELITTSGSVKGLIVTRQILVLPMGTEIGVDIAGDLEADIEVFGPLDADFRVRGDVTPSANISVYQIKAGRDVIIDGSFEGQFDIVGGMFETNNIPGSLLGTIDIGDERGLAGQININARNGAGGSGVWHSGGSVTVGSSSGTTTITLAPEPDYDDLADNSGSPTDYGTGPGAVGVVPFDQHRLDSIPQDGNDEYCGLPLVSPPCTSGVTRAIRLRHYGPVMDNGSGDFPVVLKHKAMGGGSWTDTFDDNGEGWSWCIDGRDVYFWPTSGTWPSLPRDYQITRQAGRLRCANLPDTAGGSPVTPDVDNYTYDFTIKLCFGSFDLNTDGNLDYLDTATWIADPSDVNLDSSTDSQDLADLNQAIADYND